MRHDHGPDIVVVHPAQHRDRQSRPLAILTGG